MRTVQRFCAARSFAGRSARGASCGAIPKRGRRSSFHSALPSWRAWALVELRRPPCSELRPCECTSGALLDRARRTRTMSAAASSEPSCSFDDALSSVTLSLG